MKLGLFLRLALLLFLARVAASVADTQRCFYDKDQLAPDYIIPCYTGWGNAHFSCCKVGNKCLEHNACYDSDTGNTYQYGCTDETYQDPSCPQKCDLDRSKCE
ncbi:hypothetical protein K504DRAFT_290526 [Pleomassaria siparia CBS 279.74]|uniref:Carbohydrate-binding module family 52 protein n=1 Tax=Pleomassaria siparia CBS 279.74 TaxID=1314801 RepID=A0A6G1K7K2_9PLEO|nr:hypothetical protein K504DRAFT_290526 [Pleomassaria siparia CBS 279.74]